VTEDPLDKYEFHVKIAEEDVRDGDATPWERVVAAFASTIRELQARVAELETPKTQIQELQVWGEENEIVNGEIIRRKRVLQYYVDKADGLQARVEELESRLNPPCPDPSFDTFYLDANADFDVTYIDGKPTGKVVLE